MAKIVLAGPANDPYFPRCELIADQLKAALPNFDVTKIFVQPSEWEEWLQNTCSKFGWRRCKENKGPIVWRELVNRGGKAALIGDSNDFQEFCRTYYGVRQTQSTNYLLKVCAENQAWTNIGDSDERIWVSHQTPTVVSVWNATADAAQMIVAKIAEGGVLPYDDVEFRLSAAPWMLQAVSRPSNAELVIDQSGLQPGVTSSVESINGESSSFVEQISQLEVIQANLEDMACPSVRRILNCGGNAITSSIGAKLILIVVDDSCNNDSSIESFRILGRDLENTLYNFKKMQDPQQSVSPYLSNEKTVRILFVPSSVECMSKTLFKAASYFVGGVLSTLVDDPDADPFSFPDYDLVKSHQFCVDPSKVLCLTTPLENAAKSLISKQLHVITPHISDLIIWSRPETEQQEAAFPWPFFVDVNNATVGRHRGAIEGPDPYTRQVMDLLAHEKKFLKEINDSVSSRYFVASGKPLPLTMGVCDFLRGWFGGAEKHSDLQVELHRRKLVFSAGLCKFNLPAHISNPQPPPVAAKVEQHTSSEAQAIDQQQQQQAVPAPAPEPEPVLEQAPTPIASIETGFKSLPIRFTGRDDLEGCGYSVVDDIKPPVEIFHVPLPKGAPNTGQNAVVDELSSNTAGDEASTVLGVGGDHPTKEPLASVDEADAVFESADAGQLPAAEEDQPGIN